jgi:hypothetical protein
MMRIAHFTGLYAVALTAFFGLAAYSNASAQETKKCEIETCFIVEVCFPAPKGTVCTQTEVCSTTEVPCPNGGAPL